MENKTRTKLLAAVLLTLALAVLVIIFLKTNAACDETKSSDTLLQNSLQADSSVPEVSIDKSESNLRNVTENSSKTKIKRESKKVQQENATLDPIKKAMASGHPVLVDFGRGTCIPCKKMMPILAELGEEYQGRLEVLILDLDEYYELAKEYGVQVIPTQIFFAASGEELSRHVGFMPREEILVQLESMGLSRSVIEDVDSIDITTGR